MAKKLKPMVRLTAKQIQDKLDYIDNYKDKSLNASTASAVDANANITHKNISTLSGELYKDFNIQLKRAAIKKILTEKYGEEFAEEYEKMIEDHLIYIHDETSTPGSPYCASITLYPILEKGLLDFGGCSVKPEHLESFCGTFINLVYACTANLAGAIATAEFLLYFHYFAKKDYGANYLKDHTNIIKNKFENVVYCINTPSSARSYQSCFWNISVYDRYYFNALFEHFTFPDGSKVDYDEFNELQKYFMEWFLEERRRALLTFPVVTEASLSTEDGEPKDKEWAEYMADLRSRGLSFFSYNSKKADALSSCCTTPETIAETYTYNQTKVYSTVETLFHTLLPENYKLPVDEKEEVVLSLHTGRFVDSFNQRLGIFERKEIIGLLRKYYEGILYTVTINGNSTRYTPDHELPVWDGTKYVKLTVEEIFANYNRYMIPSVNNGKAELVRFDSIGKENYSGLVYCVEIADLHNWILNGTVSGNCRLRNEIDENEFQYSLGGGGSIQTGSLQVITININRMVQTGVDLTELVKKIHKILMAYQQLVYETKEAGLLPIYDSGCLDINKQFCTIGVNGLNEAAEYLGMEVSNNEAYLEWSAKLFKTIAELNKEAKNIYGQRFNTEMIPGEGLGPKNHDWDKKSGLYCGPKHRNCYNSYMYLSESSTTSIPDKFEMHGAVADSLDGGSALHLGIAQLPDKKTFLWLDSLARKSNCNYWTTNVRSTCCEDCGYIDFRTLDSCPKCGSKNISLATRIIGYLKKIPNYSEARQKEADMRFYH